MRSAMAAFGIAVGCTSLVCYALMTRSQNSRRPITPGDNSCDSGNYADGDSWSPAGFGGHHFASGSSVASDGAGNPIDSGGGDSGGGD